jgi:hypothetical protein
MDREEQGSGQRLGRKLEVVGIRVNDPDRSSCAENDSTP